MTEDITIKAGEGVDIHASVVLEKFKSALLAVERIVNTRSTLPILSSVLIKAEKGGVEIIATDLEIGMRYFVGGKVEIEGSVTIPGKTLVGLVGSLHGETLTLKGTNTSIELTCGDTQASLHGMSAEEYPVLPEVALGKKVSVMGGKLKQLIGRVEFAVSRDDSRQVLTGVYISSSDRGLVLVATDSHRLAEVVDGGKLGEEFAVIVPAKTLAEVKRLIIDPKQVVEVRVEESQIMFGLENATVVSRLIEGEYPNYRQIIPETSAIVAEVDVQDLADAIKSAAIFSSDTSNGIRLSLGDNKISVASESSSVGSFSGEVEARVDGGGEELRFNAKYILDGLASLDIPNCLIEVTNKTSPVVLRPVGVEGQVYIVMPLRG